MESKEYKVIYAYVFDAARSLFKSSRNDKAKCTVIRCCNFDNCGLYKRGECAWIGGIGYHRCPYGKYNQETGFTKRAKSYSKWIREKKEKYKDVPKGLGSHSKVMAVVGDYLFLPYSFMTLNKSIPFLAHSSLFSGGNCFLPKTSFTIKNIINMCEYSPQALMGGEITSYQQEQIPKFIKHLSEQMPDLFEELCKEYPRAQEEVEKYSYIGRKALLKTLVPNVGEFVDIHKGNWRWDGKYLISKNSKASFMLVNKFSEIRLVPDEESVVEITDDSQVGEDTVFMS